MRSPASSRTPSPGRIAATGTPAATTAPASRAAIAKQKRNHAHSAAHVTPHAGHAAQAAGGMVEADRGGAAIERTRVGADHSLSQVAILQPFILEIVSDELGHRPLAQQLPRFLVAAQAGIDLLVARRIADPQIANPSRGPQGLAQAADHIAHRAPTRHIAAERACVSPAHTARHPPTVARSCRRGREERGHSLPESNESRAGRDRALR